MEPAEDVFTGPPMAPPPPMARRTSDFLPVEEIPTIRHAAGYSPFLAFCTQHQADPHHLASDLPALVAFLRTHAGQFQQDPGLLRAAAVFTGNTVATLRPNAQWQPGIDDEFAVGTEDASFELTRLLQHLPLASADQIELFLDEVQGWRHWEPLPPPPPLPPATHASGALYTRPPLPQQIFTTPEGQPIPYGHRWDEDPPPEEAYSRITHPERFAALHQIAQALIDHLRATYDITVTEAPASLQDLLWAPDDNIYAIRLTPNRADAAPLTIVSTTEPAVIVHAGAWCELAFPDCACDACDETAEGQAKELEQFVLAVAAGTFRERYPLGRQAAYEYAWAAPDGSSETASTSDPPTGSPTHRQDTQHRLAALPHGWKSWPPRTT
ncbi:DUF6226 family protein [uncultured Kocuria sp.]|uniref:DUF6226 family protein n=1 Tax=uncultured Kocuria sp. TaxID=259305 RepID=UPI002635E2B6|nr:DUF6226 family protein [uncultured Kocuria sp.]